MCNFKVGEKIMCISPVENLIKNEIYTINTIHECNCKIVLISLKEIQLNINHNGSLCTCGEPYFGVSLFKSYRFRKLDYQFAEDVIKQICEEPIKAEDLTKYNKSEQCL